jgi:3',5'-cyclic AMP phosphodiesterase CpdA
MTPIMDPRQGDLEDDASSTKHRSILSLAGTLLVEISLPRLVIAWVLLLIIPGLLLGAAPIGAWIWFSAAREQINYVALEFGSLVLLAIVVGVGWYGWRPLFRVAERAFWSLNSLIVQPIYSTFRETLRHLAEQWLPAGASAARSARLRAASAAVSGTIISGLAVLIILWVWPNTYLFYGIPDVGSVQHLMIIVLSNSVALISGYLAVAAAVWTIADVTMSQPRDLPAFHPRPHQGRTWRVAHLSDIHVVGERYGFRIESGRSGPQGNERWKQVLARLSDIHASEPLAAVLITGDVTDAGRSAEWAEFQDALAAYPELAAVTLMLPGNHDVNIVDRANPARLDLPTSPNRRLRQIRTLSALATLQGDRVRVVNPHGSSLGETLTQSLAPHLAEMTRFLATGSPTLIRTLPKLWNGVFPMVLPPDSADGLGIILLNSNAITHFSFTNALGMISAEQARRIDSALSGYPHASWIIALHHHVLEYPRAAKALSERIGTALINGNWFTRRLQRYSDRIVVMHGHRHVDWIGQCDGLLIVSAPSPIMEATNNTASYFYIHTLAAMADGRIGLLAPERIAVGGADA